MIGHREGPGGPRVQVLHPGLGVHPQQPGIAQRPVDVDRPVYLGDPVLAEHHHRRGTCPCGLQQRRQYPVQLGRGGRGRRPARPEALQVVVEVWDVHQGQVRVVPGHHLLGGPADPPGRGQPGARPPELEQRERAQLGGQLVVQLGREGVAVRLLTAVGVVDRAWGDRPVHARAHGVPPADVGHRVAGAGPPGRVPQLFATHQRVVLAPQQHLAQLAEVPAVAHDAVLARQRAGQQGGLHRAGDRGQDGSQLGPPPGVRDGGQPGHVLQQSRGEAGDVQDQQRGHDRPRRSSSARVKASSAAIPSASCCGPAGRCASGSTFQV